MDKYTRKKYENEIGKELLEGLEELGKIEPVIAEILKPDNTNELAKRIAAAFLITIDNRNKTLSEVVKMSNIKMPK
jgi:hypothetical protein